MITQNRAIIAAAAPLALLLAAGATRAQEPAPVPPTPPTAPETVPTPLVPPVPPATPDRSRAERTSHEQHGDDYRIRVGPQLNLYRPQSAGAMRRFGDNWRGLLFGFGDVDAPEPGVRASGGGGLFWSDRGNNSITLVPLTLGMRYTRPLGRSVSVSIAGESAFVVARMRSETNGINNGLRSTTGYGANLALHFGHRAFARVRYLRTDRIRGIDLSGIAYTAGLRF